MQLILAFLILAGSVARASGGGLERVPKAASAAGRGFAATAQVQRSQFAVGNAWLWTYFSLDHASGQWTPYFYERYAVIAEAGSMLTIEMSSDDVWPIVKPAHHRIVINFDDCARAIDPSHRGFTVHFYTTSLGNGWQLVSDEHPNLVFTEKFNCAGSLPAEQMTVGSFAIDGHSAPTFSYHGRDSFYFLNEPGLAGVVAAKLFEPQREYKFEFTALNPR